MGHVRALTGTPRSFQFFVVPARGVDGTRPSVGRRAGPSVGVSANRSRSGAHGRNHGHNQTGRGVWGICDAAPTPAARDSYPTVTATAMSIVALAIMRAAAAHSEATGARTSVSAPNGGSAWQAASRSPAPGVDAPSYPANVGISDTTTHATHGPDLSTPTATVQPEPPTRSACANTGTKPESMNNSRTAWGARVRSLAAVRSRCSLRVADHVRSSSRKLFRFAFVRAPLSTTTTRERIKKRIKIARLVIFSSRIPPRG